MSFCLKMLKFNKFPFLSIKITPAGVASYNAMCLFSKKEIEKKKKKRKTEKQKVRKTERQKDRNTERQKGRKTERQKDRKTLEFNF